MEIVVILMKIGLLISCIVVVHELFSYVSENKVVNKTAIKLFNVTESNYERRKKLKQKIMLEEGNVKDNSFITKIDLLIEHSHIKDYIPFLNTEMYVALNVMLIFGGFIFGNLLYYWLFGLIIGIVIAILLYSILYILSGINHERIENEIMKFMDIMENYAETNADIVSILGKTYPYLNEPLRSYVEDFYNEAISTGNTIKAFRNLEIRVQSEKVKELVRNLEICSRHEANYKEIIRDKRKTLKDDLRAKQQRKAIISNGRTEIIMCLAMCAIMVAILRSVIPNLLTSLTTSPIGNGILVYCIIVVSLSIWDVITFDKEG